MRLDVYLFEKRLCESRKKAQDLIKTGNVFVENKCVRKPAYDVSEGISVEIKGEICRYVGRGGLKLEGAIKAFSLDFEGKVCADIGSSTGGFTDCMLQNGARKVYAVDSGKDQLHKNLRCDERVVVMEGVNARYLEKTDFDPCDIVTMDVSFISQTLLYGSVCSILKDGGLFVSLVKPQFEAGRTLVGKNGIVKDEKTRMSVIENIIENAKMFGLENISVVDSPILGGDGNKEYLALFSFNKQRSDL